MRNQQKEEKKKKEKEVIIKTIIKQENNMEIFVTDAPDVDFDLLNEEQTRDMRERFEMID